MLNANTLDSLQKIVQFWESILHGANTENDSSSANLRVSLLSDILLSNKNLKRAISPNEACEITSFTGFSGLFYILARIYNICDH